MASCGTCRHSSSVQMGGLSRCALLLASKRVTRIQKDGIRGGEAQRGAAPADARRVPGSSRVRCSRLNPKPQRRQVHGHTLGQAVVTLMCLRSGLARSSSAREDQPSMTQHALRK